MVYDLSDEEVSALAAEDEQAAAERVRCSELLSALYASMVELKRLDGHRTAAYNGVDSGKCPYCYSFYSANVILSCPVPTAPWNFRCKITQSQTSCLILC